MADDDNSTNDNTPTPVAKPKEHEIWGVPLSTWHGLGIVAVGTISLITALKVLIPPNFTLFPTNPQQQQQQSQPQFNPFNLLPQMPQQQPVQQPVNNNNMRRPQPDNSVEEYETFDESPYPYPSTSRGPQNIDVGVGEEQLNNNNYNGDGNGNNNTSNEENELIKSDDRALRTNEPLVKSNSGIDVTIAPEVVNSQRRFMRQTYTPNNTEDVSSYDAYE